jgi:hypothetical protein
MRNEPEVMESLLLDLHLRRLEAEEAQQVEEAVAGSPELAAKSRALRNLLGLLDAVDIPEPPGNLADSVMARIDEHTRPLPFTKEAATVVPAGGAHDLSGSPMLSLRELIAIAACITLFVGIFVPGYQKAQNIARRGVCRENLRLVSAGTLDYAQANRGFLPYVGHVPNGSWLPTRTPNVPRYSNTRPVFVLLQQGHITDPRVFICPSDPSARPMIAEDNKQDYKQFSDFAERENCSYSPLFMNLPQGRKIEKMNPRMVLLADRNPYFDDRAAGHRISPYDASNSFAHEDGAGQNAVYVSGEGGWYNRPTIGVDRDNIYQAGDRTHYTGIEAPISETDSFLP